MTVTMINRAKGIEISGISVDFISKWQRLGFAVKKYDSNKIILLGAC